MTLMIAMGVFALTMSITPGPVNMVTLVSGVNNGFLRTNAYVLGATSGFIFLLIVLGLGLAKLMMGAPLLFNALSYLGMAYLVYLGIALCRQKSLSLRAATNQPRAPGFWQGALMQWANPKAWVACVTGLTVFVNGMAQLWLFALIYYLICYLSISLWALAGDKLAQILKRPTIYRLFCRTMGVGLIIMAIQLLARSSLLVTA